ncbi:MAG: hypothetical protein LKG56_09155 [Lachnospiraceae bacterium]|jgi:maltose 6'-phosphate phosphatase|nr:hypothetical protein [Lachnospiraceae bacterium]MCH4069942.1 hypothetical protein [Lachnospiraceae bacterium]MCH4108707.1 hypothetical protein [Lachnospiraceae bacterium]MCI1332435.1 hypothetical protein [Lachnospiraceae bacterium]MCI1361822.1 hypothetical protein [Lachnospiraceae bacterium]
MIPETNLLKVLTLNTHSLFPVKGIQLTNEERLETLADVIIQNHIEIVLLQEVNQPGDDKFVSGDELAACGYLSEKAMGNNRKKITYHNFAYQLASLLYSKNQKYIWSWNYAHKSYDVMEEGTAVFSALPVEKTFAVHVSAPPYDTTWQNRVQTGILLKRRDPVFCFSVHFGWNSRPGFEPFSEEWNHFRSFLKVCEKERPEAGYIVAGDYNNDAARSSAYKSLIQNDGWQDCFIPGMQGGTLLPDNVDGWGEDHRKERIDWILTKPEVEVRKYRLAFDGIHEPIISDHFGVMAEIQLKSNL